MGVSKNRKEHKKKSKQRTEEINIGQRKYKQRMLEQYLDIQRQMLEKTQKTGEVVENSEIEIDLGLDLNEDELLVDEEAVIPEEIQVQIETQLKEIVEEENIK